MLKCSRIPTRILDSVFKTNRISHTKYTFSGWLYQRISLLTNKAHYIIKGYQLASEVIRKQLNEMNNEYFRVLISGVWSNAKIVMTHSKCWWWAANRLEMQSKKRNGTLEFSNFIVLWIVRIFLKWIFDCDNKLFRHYGLLINWAFFLRWK